MTEIASDHLNPKCETSTVSYPRIYILNQQPLDKYFHDLSKYSDQWLLITNHKLHQRVWWIIQSYHRYYQLQNCTSLPVYGNRINYGQHTHFSVHYIYCFNPWRPHRSRNGLLIFYSDEFWACGVLTCVWMIEDLDRPKITIQAIFPCQRLLQNLMLRASKHNVVFVNSPIISTQDDIEFPSQPIRHG